MRRVMERLDLHLPRNYTAWECGSTANNLVRSTVRQGQLVGVDNGEQASRERYKASRMVLGSVKHLMVKAAAIVKSIEHREIHPDCPL